jgi:hypothetical protein
MFASRLALIITLVAAAKTLQDSPRASAKLTQYGIEGFRAYFYYHQTGEIGKTNLLGPRVALRNAPIGGGDAGTPSAATYVLVDISGPSTLDRKGIVHLIAREITPRRRTLLDGRVPLNTFAPTEKTSVAFIIYGTGCVPVEIVAELEGLTDGDRRTANAAIPFSCGE